MVFAGLVSVTSTLFAYSTVDSTNDLVVPEIILQSSFQAKNLIPEVNHRYELVKPSPTKEPYIPFFFLKDNQLPTWFPNNLEPSSLAESEFFGGAASVFLGDRGKLLYAIALFKRGEDEEAMKLFVELRKESQEFSDLARLWMGWILWTKKQWEQGLELGEELKKSTSAYFKQEGLYLQVFLLIEQKTI